MQRAQLLALIVCLSITTIGCATATPTSDVMRRRDNAWSSNIGAPRLTGDDLAKTHSRSTADAIRVLRPDFLRRSPYTPTTGAVEIAVYIDGNYAGGPSLLEAIPVDAVLNVTFLRSTEAQIRFGQLCRCGDGAILVGMQVRR